MSFSRMDIDDKLYPVSRLIPTMCLSDKDMPFKALALREKEEKKVMARLRNSEFIIFRNARVSEFCL